VKSDWIARQGDVLLVRVRSAKAGELVDRDTDDSIVLAHGEATGHRHRIASRAADLYAHPDPQRPTERILRARELVRLLHEEHSTIELPKGTYRVIRQRSYEPSGIRTVAD